MLLPFCPTVGTAQLVSPFIAIKIHIDYIVSACAYQFRFYYANENTIRCIQWGEVRGKRSGRILKRNIFESILKLFFYNNVNDFNSLIVLRIV